MGFKLVFDNLTVKHMDALRKQIQSLADYVLKHCFWTYAMLRKFRERSQEIIYGPIWLLSQKCQKKCDMTKDAFSVSFF